MMRTIMDYCKMGTVKIKKKKINAIHRTITFTMDSNRLSSANAFRNLMGIKANKYRSVTVVEPENELHPVFSQLLDTGIDFEEVIKIDRKRLNIPDDFVLPKDHRIYLAKKLIELEELKKTVNHGLGLNRSNYLFKSDPFTGVVEDSSSSSTSTSTAAYTCPSVDNNNSDSSTTYSWDNNAPPIQDQGQTNICYLYAAYGVSGYLVNLESGDSASAFSPKTANTCLGGVAKQCPNGASLDKGLQLLCTGAYNAQKAGSSELTVTECSSLLDSNGSIKQNYRFIVNTSTSGPTSSDIQTMIDNLPNSPIIIGVNANNAMFNYSPNETGETLTLSCTTSYNHAVVIVGYDDTKNVFKIRNSWGSTWGEGGYFYLDAIPGNYGLGTAYIYNINQGSNFLCTDGKSASTFVDKGCCGPTC